jgi:catechol 2,3-dioxygenase-like lactoylglutathione lyase family enzyme
LAADDTFLTDGVELTHILVVDEMERARSFYRDVLEAKVFREYGDTSCVMEFQGSWLLLVTGGGPTKDKPGVVFEPPKSPSSVAHSMTIRVPDCKKAYGLLKSRGATFLTPPHDWGAEIRCFFRDPDGHLLEISESVSGKG